MKRQTAQHTPKGEAVATGFGHAMLSMRLGPSAANRIIAALPVYKAGWRKGLPKGRLCWEDVTVGGWSHFGVLRPGARALRLAASELSFDFIPLWTVDQHDHAHYLIHADDREREMDRLLHRISNLKLP
jgi:hypothetical protein